MEVQTMFLLTLVVAGVCVTGLLILLRFFHGKHAIFIAPAWMERETIAVIKTLIRVSAARYKGKSVFELGSDHRFLIARLLKEYGELFDEDELQTFREILLSQCMTADDLDLVAHAYEEVERRLDDAMVVAL